MLCSKELNIAGELDVVLEMTVGTGQNGAILKSDLVIDKHGVIKVDKRRRVVAIMDWKSGRHGFYPNNEAQLILYRRLWNENFPYMPIELIYNWSPKNWTEEPSYNLKEQSESPEVNNVDHYISIFNNYEMKKTTHVYPNIQGVFKLGKIEKNITLESFQDRARKNYQDNGKDNRNGNNNNKKEEIKKEEPRNVDIIKTSKNENKEAAAENIKEDIKEDLNFEMEVQKNDNVPKNQTLKEIIIEIDNNIKKAIENTCDNNDLIFNLTETLK